MYNKIARENPLAKARTKECCLLPALDFAISIEIEAEAPLKAVVNTYEKWHSPGFRRIILNLATRRFLGTFMSDDAILIIYLRIVSHAVG